MDVAPARQRLAELHAELVDVDVDGAVVGAQRRTPDRLVELGAGHDAPLAARERGEQLELAHRERQGVAGGHRLTLVRPDLERAGRQDASIAAHDDPEGRATAPVEGYGAVNQR